MTTKQPVQDQVQIHPAAEYPSEERIRYLDTLIGQTRTAAVHFTQFTQEDVDRIVKPMVNKTTVKRARTDKIASTSVPTLTLNPSAIPLQPVNSVESEIAAASPDTEKKILTQSIA